jgi:Mycothiol maleylpyruvate isomerase N-terminal domain
MGSTLLSEVLPEWELFAAAVRERRPDAGTWCEAWTVRDVVVHQVGNAEEMARVLTGHMNGEPVETRGFEEREAPYRAMADGDLWSAVVQQVEHLSEVAADATRRLGPDDDVAWTGRTMKVGWFAEHMREELVLHRWDLTGDDEPALTALAEPWMTSHSVIAVGRPLLARGAARPELAAGGRIEGRLRVEGTDDVVVTATPGTPGPGRGRPGQNSIALAPPEGPATIESDAATRCLFLWGRRPNDPSRWRILIPSRIVACRFVALL